MKKIFLFLRLLSLAFFFSGELYAQIKSEELNDKEIIQKITERPEYTQYLFKNESELTRFSRSLLNQGLEKISSWLQQLFSNMLQQNANSLFNTNWLNGIMNFPIWETLLFFILLLIGFLIYKFISKTKFNFKTSSKQELKDSEKNWQSLSRIPDAWQSLIKEILNHYLSSINIVLQKDMSLRYCLETIENNQRGDSFIHELVEFLEKWHFSTWQPDEKIIKSWFKSIKEKSEHFKMFRLDMSHE